MNSRRRLLSVSVLGMAAWALAAAGQARIVNAKLETHAATGGLEAEMRAFLAAQAEPAWMGYAVRSNDANGEGCCWDSWTDHARKVCGRCSLESDGGTAVRATQPERARGGGPVRMEWAREMIVLLRSAGHRIGKVRAFSPDCELDAGGLRVVWLSGVNSADSVRVLSRLVTERESETDSGQPVVEGALAAIAMHGDEAADQALASFAAADRPEKLRSHAAFWLGSARGMPGLRVLEGMAKTDPSDRVRQQVAFAFSVSGEARAVDDLIRMAHEDGSGRVRGQALFWLAQKAGHRAAQAISDAIENDPDTETKRSAVFALYNMPHDEGIPLLIQVARTNRNREVRKQAFFWLGQTKDPRALAFFEEVLGR